MIRYRLNPIILLINNGGYTIEVRAFTEILLFCPAAHMLELGPDVLSL